MPLGHPPALSELADRPFSSQHIGPNAETTQQMLSALGVDSLTALLDEAIPATLRLPEPLNLPAGVSEQAALTELRALAQQNQLWRCFIGQGYYPTVVPPVIARNVFENPAWYTAYTPYQAEISQGRLESLLNFQQVVIDLTGLPIANASLLDEATAAAEAMALCRRIKHKHPSSQFFVADDVHPQTLAVLQTRATPMDIELVVGPIAQAESCSVFGALLQYPGTNGVVHDLAPVIHAVQTQGGMVAVATDLLALMLLRSPGELGADIAIGSAQRFGVPMGFGGPHAAFFATHEAHKRQIPGRIIGVSRDSHGQPALRMAMQTREQHIRREKATSNICTAQALLANMAAFYAVWHGPEGLRRQAERVHRLTSLLAAGLQQHGISMADHFFDTLQVQVDASALARASQHQVNLRVYDANTVGISFDETCSSADVALLFDVLLGPGHGLDVDALDRQHCAGAMPVGLPDTLRRTDAVLTHPVFNRYHSETELLRYIKRLENKDYSLVHGMIPLGSCTMKLNAAAEMMPVSWPEFAELHPFVPAEQARGYQLMLAQLSEQLKTITGFAAISLQPNSGAQGEYAGLLAIRRYHDARGDTQRDICLIPASAHGTNPASAAMMGMRVQIVACDAQGNVELADLKDKAAAAGDQLAACMITYPSTHGVFEASVRDLCQIIHNQGGQVYMDGANLNAQVGLMHPASLGADVCHLNLHKTFAIPHGGGGPGMGPIGVAAHLAPYLPGHLSTDQGDGAVSAAPFGSASILTISWMYNRMLGEAGLTASTSMAILNANYIAHRLASHYPILYRGERGRVAHECIIDLRPLKEASGITEEDVAKRLMDYGFHAPTMSFPVAGTLMIEPTESESLAELDRLIGALQAIRVEIDQVTAGQWPADNNPLVRAPHTLTDVCADWDRPYSRELAAFPVAGQRQHKFWPSVNRVDNVYGDRNLQCSCPPISVWMASEETSANA